MASESSDVCIKHAFSGLRMEFVQGVEGSYADDELERCGRIVCGMAGGPLYAGGGVGEVKAVMCSLDRCRLKDPYAPCVRNRSPLRSVAG